jgi:formylglycine-generating enzyme required for sulfatase activity
MKHFEKISMIIKVTFFGILVILLTVFFAYKLNQQYKLNKNTDVLVYIEGGTFIQLDVDAVSGKVYDSFQHTVSSYYIAKYETTYQLWFDVLNWAEKNGYHFENPGREGAQGKSGHLPIRYRGEPVTSVSFYDVVVWCNAYSQLKSLTPVYYSSQGEIIRDARDSNIIQLQNVVMNRDADGYRLPTEGEYLFSASCRGTCDIPPVNQDMSYLPESVVLTESNGLGLHGMSDNVWEWCWDWHGSLPKTTVEDYSGEKRGTGKIILGGRAFVADMIFSGNRVGIFPDFVNSFIGFRLAKNASREQE